MVPRMRVRFLLPQPVFSFLGALLEAKALILAAGAGTRMKSNKPKVAHEMLGKPLVRWVVDAAREAGCTDTHVVIGHGREQVEPLLDDCVISYQLEMLGTGHTVMCAADKFEGYDGCIVVLCGDSPLIRPETIKELIDKHVERGAAATVLTMKPDNPTGYGRIVRNAYGDVAGIVEEKDCTDEQRLIDECNSGVFCFNAPELLAHLDKLDQNNAQGEYYLTDMLAVFAEDGLRVASMVVEDNDECLGINSRAQLAAATKIAQRRINDQLMAGGVTMLDPDLVWVGPDVSVGADCELLPLTMLMGKTSVGNGCVIGPNTRLTDCTVGNDCSLEEVVGIETSVEDEVSAGPRAYLRPGTHLCHGAHVGTHVEIKKSTVGPDSKVPHLSYIGDCTIGTDVNIGAGSITCNYDGVNKNKTVIGDGSFIGSDTMLVAPVTLGEHVVTGAASCISKDVPSGALAIERNEQKIIEGWVDRHMKALQDRKGAGK